MGPCFFGLFAGAGVQGGQVIGRSDATASYPTSRRYTPNDIGATIYQALGVPLETEVHDRTGRVSLEYRRSDRTSFHGRKCLSIETAKREGTSVTGRGRASQ